MRHDKEYIFELRRKGFSYKEIRKLTGISMSTLSGWFKNNEWSNVVTDNNILKHFEISRDRILKMNQARSCSINAKYKDMENEAFVEYEIYKSDPLFIAGLMLYAGEGDKATKGIIRLSNIDFGIHRVFIRFIYKFMKIDNKRLRCGLLLYPDLDVTLCKDRWSKELDIPISQFHKPQIIHGRHKTKRLHFGVGSIIFSNSFLKKKLLLWIESAKKDFGSD